MAYLVLDLDATAWIFVPLAEEIHVSHTLSPIYPVEPQSDVPRKPIPIQLINPTELSALIELACSDYDGVIILTNGRWSPSIRNFLSSQLTLSPSSREKLKSCRFHSAVTDRNYLLSYNATEIGQLDKNIRLRAILKHNPELQSACFVVLDDSEINIDSFSGLDYVIPVLATTKTSSKDFYNTAKEALQSAKVIEIERKKNLAWKEKMEEAACYQIALREAPSTLGFFKTSVSLSTAAAAAAAVAYYTYLNM